MRSKVLITTFYKFSEFRALTFLQEEFLRQAIRDSVRGLLLIGQEGCNGTLSGTKEAISRFKKLIHRHLGSLAFKDSWSDKHPFHDMKVKIKREIVSLNRPDIIPHNQHFHLSPQQWHQTLEEEDILMLDTRNKYETQIGHFKGAIDPKLNEFNEFPKYLKNSGLPKDKKMLMYCTGGIRCEKALLLAREQGYNNVYQLDGGILNYLKEFSHQQFQGECFVFDYRVAVDQQLKPSKKYRLCPHCGEPGDQEIECGQCGREDVVCLDCLSQSAEFKTCSKNCAHHFSLGHVTKKPHLDGHRKRIVQTG